MSLASRICAAVVTPRKDHLWKGPEVDGVTFSMLSKFLQDRERFRIQVMEGIRPAPRFNHHIEYGQMWHACEEAFASGERQWDQGLREYARSLVQKYPMEAEQVDHWYRVCKAQFPEYIDYWRTHEDVVERTPIFQEEVFDVVYKLPSGRKVRLRGKWDSVDLIGSAKAGGIYLQENKTKGQILEEQILRQLTNDLQTMLYLVALHNTGRQKHATAKVLGVRYNVIRRPLSGGKGTIVRHKPSKSNPMGESKEEYYSRVASYIREEPETYFMRWKVQVRETDLVRFRHRTLDPILQQLCSWYDCVSTCANPYFCGHDVHWQHPFGVRNILDEGGTHDLDAYLTTGSMVGLTHVDRLFEELECGASTATKS